MILRFLTALALLGCLTSTASAQITQAVNGLLLKDGAGHELLIAPPATGWPSTGTFTWTLPFPPTGIASGYVQAGTSSLTSLQWDDAGKYWKAVANSGGLTGSGIEHLIPRWGAGGTSLTVSHLFDNGSMVGVSDAPFIIEGTVGTTPATGAGTRLMWVPSKGALRAGTVDGAQWDDGVIGNRSVAFGANTQATGTTTTAFGYGTTASGSAATALGSGTIASGNFSLATGENSSAAGAWATALGRSTSASANSSTAMGESTTASSLWATAMGFQNTASNQASTAFGAGNIASGAASTAMGYLTEASGSYSMAMGSFTSASGESSTAMGSASEASGFISTAIGESTVASGSRSTAIGRLVSTNNFPGSFIYGDARASTAYTYNTASNQFMVRASGGTIFWSNEDANVGVQIPANGNAWAIASDSNIKANRLNIEGEAVLNKLSNIWLGSWNYKMQDKSIRHYGPMAQEFFAAFGNDGIGTIGNETTLGSADVDGVTLIAVKALIERSNALERRVSELEELLRNANKAEKP